MMTPSLPREGEAACGGKPPKPPISIMHLQAPTNGLLHNGEGR